MIVSLGTGAGLFFAQLLGEAAGKQKGHGQLLLLANKGELDLGRILYAVHTF